MYKSILFSLLLLSALTNLFALGTNLYAIERYNPYSRKLENVPNQASYNHDPSLRRYIHNQENDFKVHFIDKSW